MLRNFVMVAGLLLCGVASASGGAAGAHGEENVSEFIFHHVSDDTQLTFEGPLRLWEDKHIPLPTWRVELKPGGCAVDASGHVPSLPGCLDLSVTKSAVMMWIAAVLLIGFILAFSHRSRDQLVPRGKLANIIEALVLFVRDELAVKNIGKEEAARYTPFLLTIFFFILAMNLLGLVPFMATATGNLAVTCGLAICTFLLTQVASIRSAGLGGYLAHLTGGVHWLLWPIMIPVEVLGLFTKPFALTVRLFANMLAGHVVLFFLMSLVFLMKNVALAPVGVAFAFAIYLLELFVAFLQAYVFTMLSALFIGLGVAMGHHGHDEHHDAGHAAGH